MRDIDRIYVFCSEIAGLWASNCSDIRFGQLCEIVFSEIKKDGKDPFYLEEKEMIEYIRNAIKKISIR